MRFLNFVFVFLGSINLTDQILQKELKNSQIKWFYEIKTIKAITTAYSPYETCTKERCVNSAGYRPVAAKSIACPRKYPLGTKVTIEGQEYLCDDRVSKKFPQRFDIFMESYDRAKEWGIKEKEVTINYANPL